MDYLILGGLFFAVTLYCLVVPEIVIRARGGDDPFQRYWRGHPRLRLLEALFLATITVGFVMLVALIKDLLA